MINQGQTCISPKRVLVHYSIFDEFLTELLKICKELPAQRNSLGHPRVEERLKKQLLAALKEENTQMRYIKFCRYDGEIVDFEDVESTLEKILQNDKIIKNLEESYSLQTAIFTPQDQDSILMNEELFGPVFCLYRITSKEAAKKIIKASQYGLGASLFTKNKQLQEEFQHMADAGMIFINQFPESRSELPWGGVKNSGFGRDCHLYGIESFFYLKTTLISN